MFRQKHKKLIKKIILSALLGLLLFFTAPAGITNNAANAEDSPQDAACKTTWGKICSEVTEAEYKKECQKYDQCKGYEEFVKQAQAAAGGGTSTDADIESAKGTIDFLVEMQKFLNRLIWPVLFMIGGLLDNSLLFGSGMEARLREIWIPIRNIVNMLFVIVLVGIALYNVLGIGDENGNYSIKAILPKIVVGIIAVNFSFVGIKVFLDAINVLTVSVFSLPSQIDEGLGKIITAPDTRDAEVIKRLCRALRGPEVEEKKPLTQEELQAVDNLTVHRVVAQKYQYDPRYGALFTNKIKPTDDITQIDAKVQIALNADSGAWAQYQEDLKLKKDSQICDGNTLSPQGKVFLGRWDSRNAALAMAINMGKVVFYQDVQIDVTKIEQLAINTIFSFMMWLIYSASFVALFVVLLARLVVMWLAIALSPVLLLMIAVPAIKEQISGFGEIQSKFVQNAIAPLGIALSMTIGWVMLRALQGINSISQGSVITFEAGSATIPVVGLNTLQDLVVALGTVAVVWIGVFTAASSSIAAPVTDWMKAGLQKAGSFIGTLPLKHLPLVPITVKGQKGTYTPEQVLDTLRNLGDTSHKRSDLTNLLMGRTAKGMEAWRTDSQNFTDEKGVASLINANDDKFKAGEKASIDELVKWRDTNNAAWKAFANTRQGKKVQDAIDAYKRKPSPTDDDRKELGGIATQQAKEITYDRYTGQKISGGTAATSATTAGQPITASTPLGTSTVGAGLSSTDSATLVRAMNADIATLRKALQDPSANQSTIKTAMEKMNVAFQKLTVEELRNALGADYETLQRIFGNNDAKIKTALKGAGDGATPGPTSPGGGTPTPPAPAPPGPTTTTPPPSAPGPGGGAPPAGP